jgi:hypothetical protein
MKLLRDFECKYCGREYERYVDSTVKQVECECGKSADRIIGMPRVALDGTDPSFPGAYDKWARVREDKARQKSKRSYAE